MPTAVTLVPMLLVSGMVNVCVWLSAAAYELSTPAQICEPESCQM